MKKVALVVAVTVLLAVVEAQAGLFDSLKQKAGELTDSLKEKAADRWGEAKEKATEYKDRASEKVDELKEEASKKADEIKGQVKEKATEYKDRASEKMDELKEEASKKADEIKGQVKEKATEYKDRASEKVDELKEEASKGSKVLLKKIDQASKSAEPVISKIARDVRDPEKRKVMISQARILAQEISIVGIKHVPVFDEETGRIVTLDAMMRKMVTEMGGDELLGSDLARDPVRAGFLLMVDSEAFNTVKIIQHPQSGQWMTIDEAMNSIGSSNTYIPQAYHASKSLQLAYRVDNRDAINESIVTLEQAIDAYPNQRVGASNVDLLLPVTTAGRDAKIITVSIVSDTHEFLTDIYSDLGTRTSTAGKLASATIIVIIFLLLLLIVRIAGAGTRRRLKQLQQQLSEIQRTRNK